MPTFVLFNGISYWKVYKTEMSMSRTNMEERVRGGHGVDEERVQGRGGVSRNMGPGLGG